MPAHLLQAMPMLVLGLLALASIAAQWAGRRRIGREQPAREQARAASRDLGVGLALAASWFSVWGLYAAYTWTAMPGGSSEQTVRFYLPAIGAISLLAAWLLSRLPLRRPLATVATVATVAAMFGLGISSYTSMRTWRLLPRAPTTQPAAVHQDAPTSRTRAHDPRRQSLEEET